ncbi:MAG: hypothetical protein PF569_06085 [Candidatus Woesearchaeota archaeon]|jgi:hypothetical protein|nr:hypothetical protein [Candidatus Woesearchaeota archaeon]
MKPMINMKILLFLLLLFSLINVNFAVDDQLKIFSPKYFNEQTNIYDKIHYLANEQLSFKFFSEESKNISFEITCNNIPKELEVFKFEAEDGCYFSNYDLEKLTCTNFELEINYNVNNKKRQISREFKSQKQSLLINHILSKDSLDLNSQDLSYYLIVLNEIQDQNSKENNDIYEKLKNDRDNEDKCWPENDCEIETTTNILNNLKFSNYDLNTRMLEDGKNYLEKNLINNENNPQKFEIEIEHTFESNEEISCDLIIDEDEERTYEFDEDLDDEGFIISKEASTDISFECNTTIDTINFKLYNIDDDININEDHDDISSFTYKLEPFSCNGESECNYYASINALAIYKATIKDSQLIENYANTLILKFDGESFINYEDRIVDSSKYLYYKKNDELENYIKYTQNNDGSWGEDSNYDKIISTAWAIIGLQTSMSTSEYVTDGKNWIYYNEPYSGWGSIEKNSLAYIAIKDSLKPYLKISSTNEIKNTTSFEIENPTIYELRNLRVIFSEDINKYLSYTQSLGDLKGEEKMEFSVNVDEELFGTKSGEIIITGIDGKNNEIELVNAPINVVGKELFTITQENIALSDDETVIRLEISSTIPNYNFKCLYENPFTNTQEEALLLFPLNEILISNPLQTPGEFLLEFECIYNDKDKFKTEFDLEVIKTNKTLEVIESEKIIFGSNDFSINVLNINPDRQVIEISIEGDLEGIVIPSEPSKVIAKNETREIYFSITNEEILFTYANTSNSYIVIKGEEDYVKKIPLKISTIEPEEGLSLTTYIVIIFIALSVVIFVIRRYRHLNSQEDANQNNYKNDDDLMFDDLEFEE